MAQLSLFDDHEPIAAPQEDADLAAQFALFRLQHPEVINAIRAKAVAALGRGERRISVRLIWEQVRAELKLASGLDKKFIMNNNFNPLMARMLIAENANFQGKIELRRMKRKHKKL
jgi:hypothetical protein